MVKKAFLAIIGALALVLSSMPVAIAAGSPDRTTVSGSIESSKTVQLSNLVAANTVTGQKIRPLADPPGGGCALPASGEWHATYQNGVLTLLDFTYRSDIDCFTDGPNQFMEGLITGATLWEDGNQVDQAGLTNCTNCLSPPTSQDIYLCAGQTCAGTYWVGNVANLKLPAPWMWVSAPDGCILPAPSPWITCSSVSTTTFVPPTH